MDTSVLEGLGLTKTEIKIYLTLLELGPTKVGNVIEKSNLASSAVHNSLNTLIEKGLISYIKIGKIKHYQAVPPKELVEFIEEKKKKVLEILPELEKKQMIGKEKQAAEIYEGSKGIKAMLDLLIEDVKKGDEFLFFALNIEQFNKEIDDFFLKFNLKLNEKGITAKGISNKDVARIWLKKIPKIKQTNLPIPNGVTIFKDKICFYDWGEKPVGFLINSKQITDSYKKLFWKVWEKA